MREGLFKGPGKRIVELEEEVARLQVLTHRQGDLLEQANRIAHETLGTIQTWGQDDGARLVRGALSSIAMVTK